MTRSPYSRKALLPLFDPKSIAVVGASPRAGSFGNRTVANLAGYDGDVYPVNEKYDQVEGLRCYPSLAGLPRTPDLVVLTTPMASVEPLLEECIAAGVPSVMVYASGFSEVATKEGRAAQDRLSKRAAQAGVRLLGPNCVGLLNYTSGARISFAGTPEGRLVTGPAIGLICQSGALGFALAQAMERGVGFSHVLSCGNSSDVDVADWVSALADEPSCQVIACAFEGISDPRKFLEAAQIAQKANKPLIVFKMAIGEEGAVAAMSHTASLAGSATLWQALFDRAGAVTVADFDALIETAWFFAKAPAPKADGVAVLSGSGGAAIMSADMAELVGVKMPQPLPDVHDRLKALIPPFVPARNPCDVTAGVINDMDTLLACGDALLDDPQFGALIYAYSYAYETATLRQPHLSALSAKHGKPIIYVWLTQLIEGPGREQAEHDPNIIVVSSMRRAFEIIQAWTNRSKPKVVDHTPCQDGFGRDTALALLEGAKGTALGEQASKGVLAAYGIKVPKERLVRDVEQAAQAALDFGGALVMKVDSPDIQHKTDIGGVELSITGADAARAAYDRIMIACHEAQPKARIDGILVQEMVSKGLEVIAGFHNAPGFGPVITLGLGGVLTEVLNDTVSALAPVDECEAKAMLRRLRGARLFDGYRGGPCVDQDAVAHAVAALSRIAMDFPKHLSEFDVNPLICLPDGCVAVDGLAVLSSVK